MNVNFKIISFTEIEFNGIEFDLHNNFDFLAENTQISEKQIHLYFRKSSGNWAENIKIQNLSFTLDNYTFLKQIEPNQEFIEDDFCLSGITFFDSSYRQEDDYLMEKEIPDENDDIIFSFESERIIRVNCETVTCKAE